ncbi:AraC family transcriptional regulator [Skermania sp. ID1734]|uniref:AraC family transcriptional regulator n=1 Tax=Skermania sp. ID1734 TaxID=2597516 RepID=UPI00117CBAE2|nr:AraC family transcriptional regulator [Skermania sp. ID1734]TSD95136.1 AraC family transcriptional regulator [Skermania sp. ID1734]
MTDSLEKFAEKPDALSDILAAIRLRGDRLLRCGPPTPFHVAVPAGLRVLHIAETAGLQLRVGKRTIELEAGDMVLLARGHRHGIRAGAPVPARELSAADQYRGSNSEPRWVTGIFTVEDDIADPLLSVLPQAVHVPGGRPGQEWLPLSLQLLLAETVSRRPGAWVMISRILDLLFIHALREWSSTNDHKPGWLTAAMDSRLAPVLSAVHAEPDRPWSVVEMAGLAQQSRSTFAQHFTKLLGQSPAAYVTERRLDRAAHLLRSTNEPVSRIGLTVGYTSEAAFSRAFQRHFGQPPLRWRRSRL